MGTHCFLTDFGPFLLTWEANHLTAARFTPSPPPTQPSDLPPPFWINTLADDLRAHLAGHLRDFRTTPLAWSRLTPFTHSLYTAALTVPAGHLRSYGWLALAAGFTTRASRAVGGALARNPWHLIVPCHRFVGQSGRLTGFSAPGGIDTKRRLLTLENAPTRPLPSPLPFSA